MATFWEIAARSVSNLFSLYFAGSNLFSLYFAGSNLFSLYFVYLQYLFIPRFGFKSGICLFIAPVPVHCISITFLMTRLIYDTD